MRLIVLDENENKTSFKIDIPLSEIDLGFIKETPLNCFGFSAWTVKILPMADLLFVETPENSRATILLEQDGVKIHIGADVVLNKGDRVVLSSLKSCSKKFKK